MSTEGGTVYLIYFTIGIVVFLATIIGAFLGFKSALRSFFK